MFAKKWLLFLLLLIIADYLSAQSLTDFNHIRLDKQRVSMLILGGWAVGNIALGTVMAGRREGEDRYFHLMNIGWNAVNLGLATAGYISAVKTDPAGLDLYATVQAQGAIQKILLFNAGLDVGYMLGGAYLLERARNTEKNPERLRGFGKSIVLQGAFLFAFDLTTYFIHAAGNDQLRPLLSTIRFSGDQLGLTLLF